MSEFPVYERAGLVQQKIEHKADDHVFIMLVPDDGPTISIDWDSHHGHGALSIRSDGMTIASVMTNVETRPHQGDSGRLQRFCPYCGEAFNLVSSRVHRCDESLD